MLLLVILIRQFACFWTPMALLFTFYFCFSYWTLIFLTFWLPTNMAGKADKKCCVPDCGKRIPMVILHAFPNPDKEPERFRTWLYAIGGDILALDNQKIFKYRKVCHDHFEPRYHCSSKFLTCNAVPTLHLKGFSVGRTPLTEIGNVNTTTNVTPEELPVMAVMQPSTSKGHLISGSSVSRTPLTEIGNVNTTTKVTPEELPVMAVMQPSTSKGHVISGSSVSRTPLTEIGNVNTTTKVTPEEFPVMAVMQPSISKGSKKGNKSNLFSSEASSFARKIKRLQSEKDKYALKLKKALKLSENSTFKKAMKNFTSAALIFTLLQFREINKKKMGRRFTKKEKVMSLALYKQGPRAYRWLRNIFVLPSPVTLSRMVSVAAIKPGINDNLFSLLEKKGRKMTENAKLCILLFDEISISPHFDYNRKNDLVVGFVNNGKNTTKKIADHALVFMIRGVQNNYKQPLSYSFCSGSTSKQELVVLIKEMIRKLKSIGFTVLATVCDQGCSNVSAVNYLIKATKEKYLRRNENWTRNTFEIDDEEIIPLYDPPHLIKGIRNNLLTKNLTCIINNEFKTAKWQHVIQLYNENPAYKGIRLLPKLTEQHVNPKKIMKMKVKCATQVLSRSVAVNMGYLADKGILESESKETADVILFFDELFDSVNGGFENSKKRCGKDLLGALTPRSCHEKTWTEALKVLRTMNYISENGRPSVVPTINNWIGTIENFLYLKQKLFRNSENIKSLWLRHFNQDPLENFFGCIRSHGYRNTNPTCAGFEIAFASLLINNLSASVHSPGSNCEEDSCHSFKSLQKLFFTKQQDIPTSSEINFAHISDHIFVGIELKKNDPKIMASLEYVTGYILRKTKKIFKNCCVCKSCLYDESNSSDYITLKEYKRKKAHLSYPAKALVECFSDVQDVVTYVIKENSNMPNIKNYVTTLICIMCNFNFVTCNLHKNEVTEKMQDICCQFFLSNWCRDTNRILKGLRQDYDSEDSVQKMAYNYYLKRKK